MNKKIIKNEILDSIGDANDYYLASTIDKLMPPIKLGGRWELMKLTELLKKEDIVFEYGLQGIELYIFLKITEEEIKKLVEKIK